MAAGERIRIPVCLTFGDRTIEGAASVPKALMRPADLLPILLALDNAVVGFAAELAERNGRTISCRAGCGACCRQLVPVSEAEAHYLAELVESMPPERQAQVRERFRDALARIGDSLLQQLRNTAQFKEKAERAKLGADYFRLGVPCPFLEDESCSIHPHRPMSCREYLVTSPPENCKNPAPESIQPVPLPVKPSTILYCFGDGIGNETTRWMPLVLAIEWAAAQRGQPQRAFDAPQMFRNFVAQVVRAAPFDV